MALIHRLRFWCAWWVRLTHPLTIHGQKKFSDKKVIYCINHQSRLDAVVFLSNFKIAPICLYKSEFRQNKFLRCLFDKLGYIPIKRGEADLNATKMSLSVLKNNGSLLIFPEGTRNREGGLLPFKEGAALLAIKTKTPIRPFYIKQHFNKKGKTCGRAHILVGDEFELSEYYDVKLDAVKLNEATEKIRSIIFKLSEALEEILLAKKKRRKSKKSNNNTASK